MVNKCEKYHHSMSQGNGVIVQERYKVLSPNLTLTFDFLHQNQTDLIIPSKYNKSKHKQVSDYSRSFLAPGDNESAPECGEH